MPAAQPFSELQGPIAALHACPWRAVLELAGAGSQALAWLHAVAGSSRTVLEAHDRYAPRALEEALGYRPAAAVSSTVATALAARAHARARALAPPGVPVVGLGCTAAIATDRPRRGPHRAFVACHEPWRTRLSALHLHKGRRSREEEERLVSLLVLHELAHACGVTGLPELPLHEGEHRLVTLEERDPLPRLLRGELGWALLTPDGRLSGGRRRRGIALLPGAFNPLHEGHLSLGQEAARHTGLEVFFELSLRNADKREISLAEARRRARPFAGRAPLLFTVAPLFAQKAEIFPESVFVVGADTAARLVQPRFYGNDPARMREALDRIRAAGCRFLVAGRLFAGRFQTLEDLALPEAFADLFEGLPGFRVDLSSTELRRRAGGDEDASVQSAS